MSKPKRKPNKIEFVKSFVEIRTPIVEAIYKLRFVWRTPGSIMRVGSYSISNGVFYSWLQVGEIIQVLEQALVHPSISTRRTEWTLQYSHDVLIQELLVYYRYNRLSIHRLVRNHPNFQTCPVHSKTQANKLRKRATKQYGTWL